MDEHGESPDAAALLDREIEDRLGLADVWRRSERDWDEDTLFGLVEVFHDLVARPRSRYFHDFGGCGWHYSNFAFAPARALYRFKTNELMARCGLNMGLADSGEDTGRLVFSPSDPRRNLIKQSLAIPGLPGEAVAHAIALYRARGSTRHDKRSACVALANILEDRRVLLKAELLSKDEGALFQIANQFAVRHQNADQHTEYDDAYLDWLFWWYLATVDLTDRLLTRTAYDSSKNKPW